jgi:signal transduction histidine kinase
MLVRTILALQRRPLVLAVAGIALELLVVSVIGTDDDVVGVRGIGGESAIGLAVVGAVFAGPWVGMAMATAGWAAFFPLIAKSEVSSVIALPMWLAVSALAGQLSRGLVLAERRRSQAEHDADAAHALRSPVATIRGLVEVLGRRDGRDATDTKVIAAIEDETQRLLDAPFFRGRD